MPRHEHFEELCALVPIGQLTAERAFRNATCNPNNTSYVQNLQNMKMSSPTTNAHPF